MNKDTGKWTLVDAYEFIGKSIMEYMINTEDRMVGGVYEEDKEKPTLFICNNEKDYQMYKSKGLCTTIQELEKLLNTECMPKVVIDVFPDLKFKASKSI
jgi:hypothetical protein